MANKHPRGLTHRLRPTAPNNRQSSDLLKRGKKENIFMAKSINQTVDQGNKRKILVKPQDHTGL